MKTALVQLDQVGGRVSLEFNEVEEVTLTSRSPTREAACVLDPAQVSNGRC